MTTTPRPLTAKTGRWRRREPPIARRRATAVAVGGDPVAQLNERRPQRLDPDPVDGRHREDRRPGKRGPREEPRGLRDHLGRPLRPGDVGLGHDRDPVPDRERVEQRQVLRGLRARSVVGRHDQQRGVDLARARRACCRRAGRARGRRRSRARCRRAERGGRSRRRWSCRAGAPRGAGRRRSRSARAGASSCRGRCGRPCRRRRSSGVGPGQGSCDGRRQRDVVRRVRPSAGRAAAAPCLDAADDRRVARPEARRERRRARCPRSPARPTRASRREATRRRSPTSSRSPSTRSRTSSGRPETRRVRPDTRARPGSPRSSARRGCPSWRGPARYSPSVAASAASVTLSGRTARASGSFRMRAMRSARPTMSPACGPPTSLSPLNVTTSAPAASRSAGRRLVGQPERRGVEQRTAAQVVDDDRAVRVGEPGELGRVGRLDEPRLREVRGVDAEHDGRPAVGERRLEVRRRASGSWCPTSISRAPVRRTISGIRTPPPISTSSPARDRDPATAGQPDRQRQGRRVVDGDQRVLGTGQRDEVGLGGTEAGPAAAGLTIELEQRVAGGGARRGLDRGRRPRRATEVGVQDDAGRVDDRRQAAPGRGSTNAAEAVERTSSARRLEAGRGLVPGREARPLVGERRHGPRRSAPPDPSPPGDPAARRDEQPLDARGTRPIRRHVPSVAGTRGSRTHRAAPSAAPLVLKTRGPTGTRPLPPRW